jgi:dolichol-phosphate mannosyltransferase
LLDRKVVDYYIKFWEKNRLYRWLTDWLGFNKKALIFDANKRYNWWKWSYSYSNLFNLAVNSLTSFSLFPLKLVWYIWTLITLSSVILFFVIIFDKFSLNYFNFSNLAIIVVLNTILMWIIMISLWFIALYIGKIHEEVLGRPMYIIKDKQNIK